MKKYDKILLIAVIIISLFGALMIYSSSYVWAEYKFNDPYKYLKNQIKGENQLCLSHPRRHPSAARSMP